MISVRFISVFVLILCVSLTIAGPARTFAQLAQKTSEERMKSQRSIRAPYSNSGEYITPFLYTRSHILYIIIN